MGCISLFSPLRRIWKWAEGRPWDPIPFRIHLLDWLLSSVLSFPTFPSQGHCSDLVEAGERTVGALKAGASPPFRNLGHVTRCPLSRLSRPRLEQETQQQGTCTPCFLGTQPRAGRRPSPAATTTCAIALSHHRPRASDCVSPSRASSHKNSSLPASRALSSPHKLG